MRKRMCVARTDGLIERKHLRRMHKINENTLENIYSSIDVTQRSVCRMPRLCSHLVCVCASCVSEMVDSLFSLGHFIKFSNIPDMHSTWIPSSQNILQ